MRRTSGVRPVHVTLALGGLLVIGSLVGYALDSRRIADQIRESVMAWKAPEVAGVVLGIERPWLGQTVVGVGTADRGTGRGIDPGDRFAIGSVSKTFVAAAVLQLAEEGQVGLDRTLGDYQLGPQWMAPVTIRELLSNRSGIAEFQNEAFYADAGVDLTRTYAPLDLIDRFTNGRLQFAPGSRFEYSGSNFVMLGLLIEQRTRLSLVDALRERFVVPLGLSHTDFDSLNVGAVVGYSRFYAARFGKHVVDTSSVPQSAIASAAWAGGMMTSNAHDLLTWMRALYGGHVLKPDSLRQMRAFDAAFGDYGLGTFRKSSPAGELIGHGGIHFGYLAEAWYVPSLDSAIVALANDDSADLFALAREASQVFGVHTANQPDIDDLLGRLRALDASVRRQAALDLGKATGSRASEVVEQLAHSLSTDPAPEVRAACALALGLVGRADPSAARTALQQSASDPDTGVRDATTRALAGLSGPGP